MIASACLTLGLVHAMVWWQHREKRDRLMFFGLAGAAGWFAYLQLSMMRAQRPEDYAASLRWSHVPVWLGMLAVVGYVFLHFGAGRRWLAVVAVGLRTVALVINFLVEPNINYQEITGLRSVVFLGEQVALPVGSPSLLMLVAHAALVFWLMFVVDATLTVWRRGERRRAWVTGGSLIFFITMGALQAVLSHWGVIEIPNGGSIYIMVVLVVASFELSLETQRVASLSAELKETQLRKDEEVTHLGRVASVGQVSVTLAHEMSQPLGIILSNAQAAERMVARDAPHLSEVRATLADIVAEDLRATAVIDRMRKLLQRGEAGHQLVNLNDLARDVCAIMRRPLQDRQVTLTPDLADRLPLVTADPIQLQQVLINLVLNACEAMAANPPPGRQLRITTSVDGAEVCLAVSDTGSGLPADVERIFQPYFTTKAQGLGLGLPICRSIVAAHCGQLVAQSAGAVGSVFRVILPVAATPR